VNTVINLTGSIKGGEFLGKLSGYQLLKKDCPMEMVGRRTRIWGDNIKIVGSEVLTAVSTKMAVFWVVAPCSLVEVYQRFRGPCCLHHQGDEALMMGADYTALQPRR
jgi:hypothetical protein